MSKILELRTKRNTLWEQTKDFLEKNRGENGLVKAEAVEQYNKMAQEVKDLGTEIERLEQQAQIEAQLSAPTSSPVHADPKNGAKKDVKPTATAEYAENFWNMIRNRGHYGEVRNALSVGEDTEGGFTVPDEFEKKLVEALEETGRTDLIGYTPECLIRPQKGEKYFGKQPEQQPSGEKRRPGQHGGEGNLRREVHHGGRAEHRGGKRPDVSRRNGGSVPGQKGKMSPAKKAAFAKKRKK